MLSAGALYRLRRRRSLQRMHAIMHPEAAAERWRGAVEQLPDGSSAHIMEQIDNLPKRLRQLIYEYGFTAVAYYYNEGMDGRALEAALERRRTAMQVEWLRTNYLLNKKPPSKPRSRKRK
jgi:hypothetical protein